MTYYGNAGDDESLHVTVGGREHTVGGWVNYELERIRLSDEDPISRYPRRTFVSAGDISKELAIKHSELPAVLSRLAKIYDIFEKSIRDNGWWKCSTEFIVLPTVTSPEEISNIDKTGKKIYTLCSAMGKDEQLNKLWGKLQASKSEIDAKMKNMPCDIAFTSKPHDVKQLEIKCENYAASMEKYYAQAAELFDYMATILEDKS